MYKDAEGNIIVTYWNKGLYIYNKEKDRFVKAPRLGEKDNPFAIMQIGKGKYLVSTWGDGLYTAEMRPHARLEIHPLSLTGYKPDRLKVVYDMVFSADGNIYWMIGEQGLYAARLENNTLYSLDISQLSNIVGSYVNKISSDNNDNVWVAGTFNGLYRISKEPHTWKEWTMPELKDRIGSDAELNSMAVDNDKNIWFGESMMGLAVQTNNGNVRLWNQFATLRSITDLKDVVYIAKVASAPDEIWVAPRYGGIIYRMQSRGADISVLGKIDCRVANGNILTFAEDEAQNLWIATDKGVVCRTKGGQTLPITGTPGDVRSIAFSPDGRVWLASTGKGLQTISYRNIATRLSIGKAEDVGTSSGGLFPTANMAGVCYDKKHAKMWCVTAEGILVAYDLTKKRYDDYTKYFKSYIRSAVQDILTDHSGNLWIVTYRQLLKFSPRTKLVNVYSAEDGFKVQTFIKHVNTVSIDGNAVYFGGKGGIVSINPNKPMYARQNVFQPKVSDVKIGGTSVWMGTFGSGYSISSEKCRLSFGADAQNIEIDFTTCNYSNPSKVTFAYKLEDVDDDWNYTTADKAYAYYSSLPKGTHKLLLRATDANGAWSGETVEYTVYRAPAFYETWLAYIIYIMAVAAAATWMYRRTKQRWLEREELRVARIEKQKEEELTQAKLRYFTNVSHDFLTPITVISCIIDDMKMSADANNEKDGYKAAEKNGLDRIRVNLIKLKHLIQQVLDFRKIENGKMHLEVKEGDIVEAINNLCGNVFLPMMQKKGLYFKIDVPAQPVKAWFDNDKLEKIVSNILSNAYKYTDKGGITVNMTLEDKMAIIKIADTGKGISSKDLSHIFERFYTVNEQRTDSNGIGLSLVHELVTLHHGKVKADSEVGKGTTFTVILPIDKASYTDSEMTMDTTDADRLEVKLPEGYCYSSEPTSLDCTDQMDGTMDTDEKQILIVEDNDELRQLMVRIFSRYHKVTSAANGEEALKMIAEDEPDIIVSDVMMPVMDGLEMCRKLKNDINTSHIPLILLTARNTPEDRVECYEAGADGYISKPFELPVLKARIDNFLRLRHERQQQFRLTLDTTTAGSTECMTDSKDMDKGDNDAGTNQLDMSALDRQVLDKALQLIDEHLGDDTFDVGQMADAMFMSKSSLYRKIKSLTDMSPVEFIRNIRLKRAYQMLQQEGQTVSDVAYACGFSTPRYFSTCFKNEFGITPTELKNK